MNDKKKMSEKEKLSSTLFDISIDNENILDTKNNNYYYGYDDNDDDYKENQANMKTKSLLKKSVKKKSVKRLKFFDPQHSLTDSVNGETPEKNKGKQQPLNKSTTKTGDNKHVEKKKPRKKSYCFEEEEFKEEMKRLAKEYEDIDKHKLIFD